MHGHQKLNGGTSVCSETASFGRDVRAIVGNIENTSGRPVTSGLFLLRDPSISPGMPARWMESIFYFMSGGSSPSCSNLDDQGPHSGRGEITNGKKSCTRLPVQPSRLFESNSIGNSPIVTIGSPILLVIARSPAWPICEVHYFQPSLSFILPSGHPYSNQQVLYRGVVFDRLVGRKRMVASPGSVLEAAWTSSLFFGGAHLTMHLLRDGLQDSWPERYASTT